MRYLIEEWGLRLPMATGILTALYPDEFTVFDTRVCKVLGRHKNLAGRTNFENLWRGYEEFKREVERATPNDKRSLREKDRYLWGKSFHDQLEADIETCFGQEGKE